MSKDIAERVPCKAYSGDRLDRIAFPLGGLGAGMVCIEGSGAVTNMSVRHIPNMGFERIIYASLCVKRPRGQIARVLEGPVPGWKIIGTKDAHSGGWRQSWGLPRCRRAEFEARFPFAIIRLSDQRLGVDVEITAWSPFTPGETDDSCAPVAALEYRFRSRLKKTVDTVFGFHSQQWNGASTPGQEVKLIGKDGFLLWQPGCVEHPEHESAFSIACDSPNVVVNPTWFRSGGWDNRTVLWKEIVAGDMIVRPVAGAESSSGGGSLYAPITLKPGEWSQPVRVRMAWYTPHSSLRVHPDDSVAKEGCGCNTNSESKCRETFRPWYAARFKNVEDVDSWWRKGYDDLRARSMRFSDCLRSSTLPTEVMDAVTSNLTILKSPTLLRQTDGRIWAWEGCCDDQGCCPGSCTHVWNYVQALAHLFPDLERGLRETEFRDNQDERGHQNFRAALPIGPVKNHSFHAAADGQLGGIVKIYRDWRVSGDTDWLRGLWPQVKQSLTYCMDAWDPDRCGALLEPHHNTYDIEFWGADGMCTSMYLAALKAVMVMAEALGEDASVWRELYEKGRRFMEDSLFDGEYFIQKVQWKGLRAADPTTVKSMWGGYSLEACALLECEGPKHQYGSGCLSDGVIGAWLAVCSGLGDVVDPAKVRSHLLAVHRYNLRHDLSEHANPQRPGYALGNEGGLLLCSWPKGGDLTLPFIYSQEVWTGIEYQVASHLVMSGCVEEGLEIVRTARSRYDGRVRNPFDEYECGHWYARALSSYALLQAFSGARYDAVTRTLHLAPSVPGDFACFLAVTGCYGLVGVRDGKPFFDVWHGMLDVRHIDCRPAV